MEDQVIDAKRDFIENGRWRRARKTYKCRNCGNPILPGSWYWEDYNSTPAYQSGYRYDTCILDPSSREWGLADPKNYPGTLGPKGGR